MTGVIQSYGAGVQSRALLHMALDGTLGKRPDRLIFSDTQVEPQAVYDVLHEDKAYAEAAGIPLDIVTAGDLRDRPSGGLEIPAFTLNPETGSKGMLRRQCTGKYKIAPLRRRLRELGYTQVTTWLGITTDEAGRMKPSDVKWCVNEYPLIEAGLSRDDCAAYLARKGLKTAKSACVFCPYRSNYGWAKIRENPADWKMAVEYDRVIRDQRPEGGDLFVHPDRVPLEQASIPDLSTMRALFDDDGGFGNECEGHCGV